MATREYRPLTTEETSALTRYAAAHGRTWKASLQHDWMTAALTGPIHALRNSHGPSWLVAYKLPAAEPAPKAIRKTMRVGTVKTYGGASVSLYVRAEYEEGRLSISGVIGPRPSGNAAGGCGQIEMEFAHRDPKDNDGRYEHPITPDQITFADGWTANLWLDLLDIWKKWHLNDMRPGCEHQMAEGWDKRPIDPTKPTSTYGKHFPGQKYDSWNMLAWVRADEHPDGLLSKPCPTCGYKYGSAWRRVEVPAEVIAKLQSYPDADRQPAWV